MFFFPKCLNLQALFKTIGSVSKNLVQTMLNGITRTTCHIIVLQANQIWLTEKVETTCLAGGMQFLFHFMLKCRLAPQTKFCIWSYEMPGSCQIDYSPLISRKICGLHCLNYCCLHLVLHHPSLCQQARLRPSKEKCHVMRPETKLYFCSRFKVMRLF